MQKGLAKMPRDPARPRWPFVLLAAAASALLGLCALSAKAQPRDPRDLREGRDSGRDSARGDARELTRAADRALRQEFGDARLDVVNSRTINGERVAEVRVATDGGDGFAMVTDAGDFLVCSHPVTSERVPRNVGDQLSALFRDPPRTVSRVQRTEYVVDVAGRRGVRLHLDPTGRLRNMESESQVRIKQEAEWNYEWAGERERDAVMPFLDRYVGNARVKRLLRLPDVEDYLMVKLTAGRDNLPMDLVISSDGRDVSSYRAEVDVGDVPRAVVATVKSMYRNADIQRVYRSVTYLFRLQVPAGQDEVMVMIRPTGEIYSARGDQAGREDDTFDSRVRGGRDGDAGGRSRDFPR